MKKFLLNLLKVLTVVKEVITMPISVLIVVVFGVLYIMTTGCDYKEYVMVYWYLYKLAWKYIWEIDDLELVPEYIEKYVDEGNEYCKREGL